MSSTLTKMNLVLYIFVVLYCVSSEATLSKNKALQSKEISIKTDGALPVLHIIFDTASEEDGSQSLSVSTRYILSKLLNATANFDKETMMSVSTFSGNDSGDGNYLNILSPPVNVIGNSQALYHIILSDVPANVTNDTTRDPGAAIRDALISLSSPDKEDILYLVSRRYVDGGPTVQEIDMIDALLGNMTLICVEGADTSDPNRTFNLDRIARLTEGYHFTNTPEPGFTWSNINSAAANKLIELSKEPINSVRRTIGRSEYLGVSNDTQRGSFLVSPDLGNNTGITIQSSQKGIVTVVLTNLAIGATVTLTTKGGTNWNMINSNLYVDDGALPPELRGRWTYALTYDPAIDALNTKSDVVILGLSSQNTHPFIDYLPGVWTLNCNLDFPIQQSTIIYAEVIGPIGGLTGLSVTVHLKNVDDTNSQDVSIILAEEVQGMGLYSGNFNPPSDGVYEFLADFKTDTDSACTGDLCAPEDFSISVPGRCQIAVHGKGIDTTSTDGSTKEPTEDFTDDSSTISTDSLTNDSTGGFTVDSSTISPDGSTSDSTGDFSSDSSTVSPDGSTNDSTSDSSTNSSTGTTNEPTGYSNSESSTVSSSTGSPTTKNSTHSSTDDQTISIRTTDGIQTDEQTDDFTGTQTNNPISTSTNQQTDKTITNESTRKPTDIIPTEIPTGYPTEEQTAPTSSPTVNTGLIIGLCVGIGLFIVFLMILLYCCLNAEKEKDEERGSSAQANASTPPRRSFVEKWRPQLIPSAVLRQPPAVASSSSSTKSMPYKTMDDDSTSTQPYRRKDTSTSY